MIAAILSATMRLPGSLTWIVSTKNWLGEPSRMHRVCRLERASIDGIDRGIVARIDLLQRRGHFNFSEPTVAERLNNMGCSTKLQSIPISRQYASAARTPSRNLFVRESPRRDG